MDKLLEKANNIATMEIGNYETSQAIDYLKTLSIEALYQLRTLYHNDIKAAMATMESARGTSEYNLQKQESEEIISKTKKFLELTEAEIESR